jgi:L-iditol 2-dehydrogenase
MTAADDMPALIRTADGPRVVTRLAPRPGPGWVRVRVELAGVCRTDVAAAHGALEIAEGCVLGHELVGVVDDLGDGCPDALLGQRASVDPRLPSGRFLGLHADGAFAGWVCVPRAALVPVPSDMPARRAAFVEPLAAALAVLAADLPAGSRAGLTGAGRIALLTERVLVGAGVDVVRVDPLTRTSNAVDWSSLDALVHTSGSGLPRLDSLRRGARVIVKARPAGPVAVDLRAVTERELILLGASWASFSDAVQALSEGAIAVDDLLGDILPLSDHRHAFCAAEDTKTFLAPWG